MSLATVSDALLRDPAALTSDDVERVRADAPALLALTVGGAMVWGGAVASGHGGWMVPIAAVKAPFLLLIPVAVCLPAMRALSDRDDARGWPHFASAGLVASARTAIVAAAMTPLIWLWMSLAAGYHLDVLVAALSLAAASLPAAGTLIGAMPRRGLPALVALAMLAATTAQTGWILRPFILRPSAEVAFLRAPESDVFSSMIVTTVNAHPAGDVRWSPVSEGLLAREQADGEAP